MRMEVNVIAHDCVQRQFMEHKRWKQLTTEMKKEEKIPQILYMDNIFREEPVEVES